MNRRERREFVRRDGRRGRVGRRDLVDATADIGDALLVIRDEQSFLSEGFASFEAFCAARVPAMCPAAWNLGPAQVDELVVVALELAEKRRRKPRQR